MTDEFDEILHEAGFDAEQFEVGDGDVFATGIIPPSVDDHMAWHLLEGLVQFTACLYAGDEIAPAVEVEAAGFELVMEIGLHEFCLVTYGSPQGPELHTPEDVEFMAWVRVAAGQCAIQLERFLAGHGIRKLMIPVELTGHGWYPLSITAGEHD